MPPGPVGWATASLLQLLKSHGGIAVKRRVLRHVTLKCIYSPRTSARPHPQRKHAI